MAHLLVNLNMAKALKFEVKGIKATQAFIIAKNIEATQRAETGVKQAGEFLKDEVQASIKGNRAEPRSVDTEELLNSVGVIQNGLSVSVYSDVKQAGFMENGTSRIPARRHFGNSMDRNKDKTEEIVASEVRKI